MKLFENGVGRPSNEIKKKRKIFIASAIALCVALISAFSFALTKVDTDRLQGATYSKKSDVKADVRVKSVKHKDKTGSTDLTYDLGVYSYGSAVNEISYIMCKSLSNCKANNAWKIADAKKSGKAKNGGPDLKVKKNSTSATITNYLRVATYPKNSNKIIWKAVYKITAKYSNGKYTATQTLIEENFVASISELTTTTAAPIKSISLNCANGNYTVGTWNDFRCNATSGGKAVEGFKVYINGKQINFDSTLPGVALDEAYDGGAGKKNWFKLRFYDTLFANSDFKNSISGNKFIGTLTIKKDGVESSKTITVTGNPSGKMDLKCPASAVVGTAFKCEANQPGVKIKVHASNVLASRYKATFTTTNSDLTKSVKFTSKLFTSYPKQIKKDSNGAEYINAKISATKTGSPEVAKYVKIYKSNLPLELSCPASAKIGQAFKCSTNQTGVVIKVHAGNALARGYNSSYKTVSQDLTKDVNFTIDLFTKYLNQVKKDSSGVEYINARISATKNGKTVYKDVKIVK